jgi:hypothetical protein
MSIDRETWNKLDADSQAQWDKLSPEAKNMILSSARQKGIDSTVNKSTIGTGKFPPKSTKSLKPNGSALKTDRSTNEHISDKCVDTQENQNHIHFEDSDDNRYMDTSEELENASLVQMAKGRATPSDIRAILSSTRNKQPRKPDVGGNRSISFQVLEESLNSSPNIQQTLYG